MSTTNTDPSTKRHTQLERIAGARIPADASEDALDTFLEGLASACEYDRRTDDHHVLKPTVAGLLNRYIIKD